MTTVNKSKKEINNLCRKCRNNCKQEESVLLVECRRYIPVPVQLEFKFYKNKKDKK